MQPVITYFKIDWLLVEELAIGPAPRATRHLDRLEKEGIRGILSLCTKEEAPPPKDIEERFNCKRLVLPDHSSGRLPTIEELTSAIEHLRQLMECPPVFVHCIAAVERSPLVCMAWLIQEHRLSPSAALDYLMQSHPGSNPLPGQLRLLEKLR